MEHFVLALVFRVVDVMFVVVALGHSAEDVVFGKQHEIVRAKCRIWAELVEVAAAIVCEFVRIPVPLV